MSGGPLSPELPAIMPARDLSLYTLIYHVWAAQPISGGIREGATEGHRPGCPQPESNWGVYGGWVEPVTHMSCIGRGMVDRCGEGRGAEGGAGGTSLVLSH